MMRAYRVSKESNYTMQEKIDVIDGYNTGELLYVIREFEDSPGKFDPGIIKRVSKRLREKGIIFLY